MQHSLISSGLQNGNAIAKTIIEQGADYVLALKGNQGNLHDDVSQLFTSARAQKLYNIEHQFHSTVEKEH